MRKDLLSRDTSDSSVSYELFRDNHAREYFKPTKIPGWQCHVSRGDWWILLSHFSPPMIFPELATGFSELKSSPLSRALEFLPGTGTGFLPANDSGLAGGKGLPEKHIARGQLGKLSRENLSCLASGTRLGIWRGEREEGGEFQIFPGLFLELALVVGKKKGKNSEFCSPTDKRWDKQAVAR